MNENEFVRQYLGVWESTAEEQLLYELCEEYHVACEAYDRTVCTGPIIKGSVSPANAFEHSRINKYASILRNKLNRASEGLGFSKKELQRMLQQTDHNRGTY